MTNCKKCNKDYEVTQSELDFLKKITPRFGEKSFDVPAPTMCHDCRQQIRLSFYNRRTLYKRKCDLTGSPSSPYFPINVDRFSIAGVSMG